MQQSIWDEIKYLFQRTDNVVLKLIFVNVGVYVAINLLYLVLFLFNGNEVIYHEIIRALSLPADVMAILYQPWSPITYMFLHQDLFHILFNMLILYWFGIILQDFMGSRKILPIYIYGGLAGAALYIIAYNVFPVFQDVVGEAIMLGASAGVLGVLVAAATLVPNYRVYLLLLGPVQLKYIAIFLVIIDLVSIPRGNAGGHIAHLGGALFGFLFVKRLQQGSDWSTGLNAVLDRIKNFFKPKPARIRVEYKNPDKRYKPPRHQATEEAEKQKKIDAILDKIAQSGYDSLTEEEKEFLFKASKDD
jgi:membrane associated rhomboid family serine protease